MRRVDAIVVEPAPERRAIREGPQGPIVTAPNWASAPSASGASASVRVQALTAS